MPLIWPAWLSNAWPRVLLFLLLGTFSTTIVALPPATSWMLIGLIVMAILTLVLPGATALLQVPLPDQQLHQSLLHDRAGDGAGRLFASRATDARSSFCLTGSAKGWGCPYGLCVGEVDRNNDCGACMECVKTCAYDNVAVFWRSAGWDKHIANYGEAWQAIVMFALACLYCFINLGAWDKIRDWIDFLDKQNWGTFSVYAVVVWVVCLGVLPLLWYLLTRAGIAISRSTLAVKDSVSGNHRRADTHWTGLLDRLCAGDRAFDDDLRAAEPVGSVQLGMESPGHGRQPLAHYLVSGHSVAAGGVCSRRRRRMSLQTLYHCWLGDGSRQAAGDPGIPSAGIRSCGSPPQV